MKRNLLSLIFVLSSVIVLGSNQNLNNNKNNPPVVQPNVVNALDSIVIDLSQQISLGNNISFPVSIISDDTIFSLDFSFKFNHVNFIYDTITDVASNLFSTSNYNASDSTVLYTSYSLQQLPNNTSLVLIHFVTLGGGMCYSDLNNIQGYLNGDLCSVKLINCSFTGIADVENLNNFINAYPNPASEFINVESSENATVALFDLNGKTIISPVEIHAGEKLKLKTGNIVNGIYILKTFSNGSVSTKKIAINN